MRMSPTHHIPSQAVTRPVSPSQPEGHEPAKRTRTSPTPDPLEELQFYPNPNEPEESNSDSNLESIDFINAMHTADDPNAIQPEDVALLLYLGHILF